MTSDTKERLLGPNFIKIQEYIVPHGENFAVYQTTNPEKAKVLTVFVKEHSNVCSKYIHFVPIENKS